MGSATATPPPAVPCQCIIVAEAYEATGAAAATRVGAIIMTRMMPRPRRRAVPRPWRGAAPRAGHHDAHSLTHRGVTVGERHGGRLWE